MADLKPVGLAVGPLSPAVDLLLCCARTRIEAETVERIRALASGAVNWVEFAGLARHHGILPLAWSGLRNTCPDPVPPAVVRELDRATRRSAEQSRHLAEELVRLLGLFAARAIPAIPLKGPALAAAVYGDVSLRESVDIDILVRRCDAAQARDLLLAEGYELRTPLNGRGFPAEPGKDEFTFAHSGRRTQVELCWRIAPEPFRRSLELEDLNERAQPVRLLGTPVAGISPEEHLVVSCVHGGKHAWLLLKWVCDTAELMRAQAALDWNRVWKLAARLRCRRAVAVGLLLAHDIVDAPLSQAVLSEAMAQTGARRLASRLRAEFFAADYSLPSDAPNPWSTELVREWQCRRYFLRLVDRGPDTLWNGLLTLRLVGVGLRLLVPTEKDRHALPLPPTLALLYYLIRPVRVAVQCALQFAALLTRARTRSTRSG